MVELVDTLDLGSSAERCGGSTPSIRTKKITTIDAQSVKLEHPNSEILLLQQEYWVFYHL